MSRFLTLFLFAICSVFPQFLWGGDFWAHAFGDHSKHLWSFWHTYTVFFEGSWPWTRFLNAPTGGVLWDIMLGPSIVLIPVTGFLGPVAACHIWIVLSRFLTMWLQYKAAILMGAGWAPACCSAIVLAFTPYVLGYPLVSGVYERLSIWFFPLIICSVYGFKNWAQALYLGFGFLFLSISCAAYAYYGGMILFLLEC